MSDIVERLRNTAHAMAAQLTVEEIARLSPCALMIEAAAEIERLTAERDTLLAQLPEGMKHCTIQFKECEKGHGHLTATNWIDHGCPTCERDTLREALQFYADKETYIGHGMQDAVIFHDWGGIARAALEQKVKP